jgi:hypothetical protein
VQVKAVQNGVVAFGHAFRKVKGLWARRPDGKAVPLQASTLRSAPDGSVRHALLARRRSAVASSERSTPIGELDRAGQIDQGDLHVAACALASSELGSKLLFDRLHGLDLGDGDLHQKCRDWNAENQTKPGELVCAHPPVSPFQISYDIRREARIDGQKLLAQLLSFALAPKHLSEALQEEVWLCPGWPDGSPHGFSPPRFTLSPPADRVVFFRLLALFAEAESAWGIWID